MSADPFFITGPALISFSGGRTSAYMLWRILQAHGGKLPSDVVVAFANTGKEREETLRFVHECSARWGVDVAWVEYRKRSGPARGRFERVGFNSAARNGEPLALLIEHKKFMPNSLMRFCTEEAKVNAIRCFLEAEHGFTGGDKVIGLRSDEGARLLKGYAKNDEGGDPWPRRYPLDKAKITKADVYAFWWGRPDATFDNRDQPQGFDLELRTYEGNCDLCFLKAKKTLRWLIRQDPSRADWWISMERVGNGRFVTEYSYADLVREVREQPDLFHEPPLEDARDGECGDECLAGAA